MAVPEHPALRQLASPRIPLRNLGSSSLQASSSPRPWLSSAKASMDCSLIILWPCQSMEELGLQDSAGHSGGPGRRRQMKHSGLQGTDPRDKLPGNRRPTQDLNTSGHAAEPYGNELLASQPERCDRQHEVGRCPSPLAPISSLAQQNAVSFTFPTSLGLSPASKHG